MKKKIAFLQFVEPKHLDMHSVIIHNNDNDDNSFATETAEVDRNDDKGSNVIAWQTQFDLSKPISDIQSLDKMYSPAQMLRSILEIYRGVNEALSSCLQMTNTLNSKSTDTPNVSADDLLPSLILSVIHARPKRITSVLTFLDVFATEEQLRGEAGYAFTHLYSAVQFIKELDLKIDDNGDQGHVENNVTGKPTLSISKEILQKKMQEFREQLATACESKDAADISKTDTELEQNDTDINKDDANYYDDQSTVSFHRVEIPTSEVKAARLRGEDLQEWARQWVASKNEDHMQISDTMQNDENSSKSYDGVLKSCSFLATDPKDVKISDIPALLEEYKMLVRATETLMLERNNSIQLEQQKKTNMKRNDLESAVQEVMDDNHI